MVTRFAAALLAPLLLLPSVASADPLVIRPDGGTVALVLDFEGDFFRFAGAGFTVNQSAAENVGLFFTRISAASCDPCGAGDIYNPSFRTTGEIPLGTGTATFGGTTHTNVNLFGTLDFAADPFEFRDFGVETFFLHTPFSFTGSLRGTRGTEQVFAATFVGQGQAQRAFDRAEGGLYYGGENHQVFQFETPASTAPVPEPGTMLLLGTGLVYAGRRARSCLCSRN